MRKKIILLLSLIMVLMPISASAQVAHISGPCSNEREWHHVIQFDFQGRIDYIDVFDCNGTHSRLGGCVFKPGNGGLTGGDIFYSEGTGLWVKDVHNNEGKLIGFYGINTDGSYWHFFANETTLLN